MQGIKSPFFFPAELSPNCSRHCLPLWLLQCWLKQGNPLMLGACPLPCLHVAHEPRSSPSQVQGHTHPYKLAQTQSKATPAPPKSRWSSPKHSASVVLLAVYVFFTMFRPLQLLAHTLLGLWIAALYGLSLPAPSFEYAKAQRTTYTPYTI